jgi:hypothetical protein
MVSSPQTVALVLLMLFTVAGCRGTRCCLPYREGSSLVRTPMDCRSVEPSERIPNLTDVPAWENLPVQEDPDVWCELKEEETRVMAADRSTFANVLDQEAAFTKEQFLARRHLADHAHVAGAVVRLAAREQRNRSAAQALELLLRLAEVQNGERTVTRGLAELQEMLDDLKALEQQGIAAPVTAEEVEGQRLELLDQRSELAEQARLLEDQLSALIGERLEENRRFWPELSLAVEYSELDHAALVAFAHENRPELRALRLAAGQPPEVAANLGHMLIAQTVPGAGLAASPISARLGDRQRMQEIEGTMRIRQMRELLAYRERAVEREVVQAARGIEQSYSRIAWSARRLALAEGELEMLERRQEVTSSSPPEVRRARLRVNSLRQEVLHEVIEWKLQRMKLQEAQGRLAEGIDDS